MTAISVAWMSDLGANFRLGDDESAREWVFEPFCPEFQPINAAR